MIKSERVEKILEDLSYSFSSPEAADFYRLITEGELSKARGMLVKEIEDEADIQVLMDYFIAERNQKYSLKEFTPKQYKELKAGENIVLNYFGIVVASKIHLYDNDLCFYYDSRFISISKAQQVWLVIKS